MKFKAVVEYEYPIEHKPPVKAEIVLHGDRVITDNIKWVEQDPCDDAISRQAVDTLVDELARAISDERCCISRGRSTATIMQDILDLPPVTPKGVTVTDFADRCRECGREKVLDKIRAEISALPEDMGNIINTHTGEIVGRYISNLKVLQIIDKYKAESEE